MAKDLLRVGLLPDAFSVSDKASMRKIIPEDEAELFGLLERNADIPKHVAWASRVSSSDDIIPSLRARSNEQMDGRYAILLGGVIVGAVWASEDISSQKYSIGYCLDEKARGRGLATDAVAGLMDQLMQIGAEEVILQIVSTNSASTALPKRLGFALSETVMGVDFPVLQDRWIKPLIQSQ